jgi:hypothetical protein
MKFSGILSLYLVWDLSNFHLSILILVCTVAAESIRFEKKLSYYIYNTMYFFKKFIFVNNNWSELLNKAFHYKKANLTVLIYFWQWIFHVLFYKPYHISVTVVDIFEISLDFNSRDPTLQRKIVQSYCF